MLFNPDVPRLDHHECIYQFGDGEGVAGDPVTVSTDAADETNAAATKNDFWGEPMALLPPTTVAVKYAFVGLSLFGTTTGKALRMCVYRVIHSTEATRAAGNAWNEGATVLTLNSEAAAAKFVATDLVWITSSAYKPNGEILKVASQAGATVTLARETVNAGASNTGLRWAHTTNIGAGTLKIYRCWRDVAVEHVACFDFSVSSAKAHESQRMHEARLMMPNSGLIIRAQNATDDGTSTFDAAAIYHD